MSRKTRIAEAIKALEANSIIDTLDEEFNKQNASYHYLYNYLQTHFRNINRDISYQDYVIGSHIVYAWMPTILQFKVHPDEAKKGIVKVLKRARKEKVYLETSLDNRQISSIALPFNGSLVGPSKFLHFLNPEAWPIWDSRVYRGIMRLTNEDGLSPYHYEMTSVDTFKLYVNTLRKIASSEKQFKIKEKYQDLKSASNLRCLELGLFIAGKK